MFLVGNKAIVHDPQSAGNFSLIGGDIAPCENFSYHYVLVYSVAVSAAYYFGSCCGCQLQCACSNATVSALFSFGNLRLEFLDPNLREC